MSLSGLSPDTRERFAFQYLLDATTTKTTDSRFVLEINHALWTKLCRCLVYLRHFLSWMKIGEEAL